MQQQRRLMNWRFAVLAVLAGSLVVPATAQETTPYPNGTSGIKAGTVPPPGRYWLMYDRLYTSDTLIGPNGEEATAPGGGPLGFDISAWANVHRYVNSTDYEILGANYAWNVVVPLALIDMHISAAGVNNEEFKLADLNMEPFILEWHMPRYDFGYLYGLFIPTADRSDNRPALPGKAFWTHYVGAAGTYYFDDDRTWSASILSRWEIPTRRQDKDITPGQNFSFEWGVARNIEQVLDIGVSGYCSWQTTLDRGADVTYPNVLDRAFAIGPEIQYFSVPYNVGYHFRCWKEFGVVDRPEGVIATLTIVKPF
jgi:hypothetical protein